LIEDHKIKRGKAVIIDIVIEVEVEVEEGVEVEVEKGILRVDRLREVVGIRKRVEMTSVDCSLVIVTTTWRRYSSNKVNHIRLQCVLIFRVAIVSKGRDVHLHILRMNSTNTNRVSSVQPLR